MGPAVTVGSVSGPGAARCSGLVVPTSNASVEEGAAEVLDPSYVSPSAEYEVRVRVPKVLTIVHRGSFDSGKVKLFGSVDFGVVNGTTDLYLGDGSIGLLDRAPSRFRSPRRTTPRSFTRQ